MIQKMAQPIHLLLDGSDRLGKTTVVNLLSRMTQLPIIKMPNMSAYIKGDNPEEFSKLFNEVIVQFAETSFILDRGFTSSLVYSKVFNRPFDLSYINNIEQILKPKVFIFTGRVFHSPSPRFLRLGNDEIFKDNLLTEIDREFTFLAEERGYNLIEVYRKSPIEICNEILEKI